MEITLDRRSFLKIMGLSTLISSTNIFSQTKKGHFGKLLISNSSIKKTGGSNFHLLIKDLDNEQETLIPTTSPLHSFEINPLDHNELVSMGQWENELFVIDLKNLKIKRVIRPESSSELFVGHGLYSPDGKFFYASMADYSLRADNLGEGLINVYEVSSGKKIKSFSSGGYEPHSISWFDPGKKLLILNPGIGPDPSKLLNKKNVSGEIFPSITLAEIPSGENLKKIDLRSKKLCFGHLSEDKNNEFFIIGGKKSKNSKWQPIAYKLNREMDLTSMGMEEASILAPLLSPLVDRAGKYSMATAPTFNKVYFWDFKTGSLIKKIEAKSPTGVALTADNSHFAVVTMDNILLFDNKNLNLIKTIMLEPNIHQGHCRVI